MCIFQVDSTANFEGEEDDEEEDIPWKMQQQALQISYHIYFRYPYTLGCTNVQKVFKCNFFLLF